MTAASYTICGRCGSIIMPADEKTIAEHAAACEPTNPWG